MRVNIYQINRENDSGRLAFMDLEFAKTHGGVSPENYKCVFRGDIKADTLEEVFNICNTIPPTTYQGHSLSVSDLVEVVGDTKEQYGRIDVLYRDKDGNGQVGDSFVCYSAEDFQREIEEYGMGSISPHILKDEHIPSVENGVYFCDSVGFEKIDGFDTSLCREMDGLRVLMIQPYKTPVETYIKDELSQIQRAVSDHGEDSLFQTTYPFDDNVIMLGNDEAKLIGMQGNRRIEGSVYAGPLFIIGDNGCGEFCSLTDEQIQKYSEQFAKPEDISQEEVQEDCGFIITGL